MATLVNYNSTWLSPPPPPRAAHGNIIITPINVVQYAASGVVYSVSNLTGVTNDAQLVPHSYCRGVKNLYNFVNNGDGTGTFTVDFEENYLVYTVVVYTIDQNGTPYNSGYTSSYAQVNVFEGDTFLMYPKIYPESYMFYRMIDSIPDTKFLNKNQPFTTPYSSNDTTFNMEVKEIGTPVTITMYSMTNATQKRKKVVIPTELKFSVDLRLSKGINVITMSTDNDEYTVNVASTNFAVWLDAFSEELYKYIVFVLENQYTAVLNSFGSMISMPLLKEEFQDIFPNSAVYTAVAMRMYAKSFLNNAGKQKGVLDLFKGFLQNTPVVVENDTDYDTFDLVTNPVYTDNELFSGLDLHLWSDSYCIASWHWFKKYLINTGLETFKASDNQSVFYDHNGYLQKHLFSFLDSNCSVFEEFLSEDLCYEGLDIEVAGSLFWNIQMCINYPFDSIMYNVDSPDYDTYSKSFNYGTLLAPNNEPYSGLSGNTLSFFVAPQKDYELSLGRNTGYSTNNTFAGLSGKTLYLNLKDETGTIVNTFFVNFTTETTALAIASTINAVTGIHITAGTSSGRVSLKANHDNLYVDMSEFSASPTQNALSSLGVFALKDELTFGNVTTVSGVISEINSSLSYVNSYLDFDYQYISRAKSPFPTLPIPVTLDYINYLNLVAVQEDGTDLQSTTYFTVENTITGVVSAVNAAVPSGVHATSGVSGEVILYTTDNVEITDILGNAVTVFGGFTSEIRGTKIKFKTTDKEESTILMIDTSGTSTAVLSAFGFTSTLEDTTHTLNNYNFIIKEKANIVSTTAFPISLSGVMELRAMPKEKHVAYFGTEKAYTGLTEPFAFNGGGVPSLLRIGYSTASGTNTFYNINLTTETTAVEVASAVNSIVSNLVASAELDGSVSFQVSATNHSLIAQTNTFGFVELGNIVLKNSVTFAGNKNTNIIDGKLNAQTNGLYRAYDYYNSTDRYVVISLDSRYADSEFYLPAISGDNQALLSAMGYSFVLPTSTDFVFSTIDSEAGYNRFGYVNRLDVGLALDSFVPEQISYGSTRTIVPEPYYNLYGKYFTIQYLSGDSTVTSSENIIFSGSGFGFISGATNTAEEVAALLNYYSSYINAYVDNSSQILFRSLISEDGSQLRIIAHPTASSLFAFGWSDYFSTNKGDFIISSPSNLDFIFTGTDGSVVSITLPLSATTYTASLLASHITNNVVDASLGAMAKAEAVGDSVVVRCIRTDYLMTFNATSTGYIALGGFTVGELIQTDVSLPCVWQTGHSVTLGIDVQKDLLINDIISCSGTLEDP